MLASMSRVAAACTSRVCTRRWCRASGSMPTAASVAAGSLALSARADELVVLVVAPRSTCACAWATHRRATCGLVTCFVVKPPRDARIRSCMHAAAPAAACQAGPVCPCRRAPGAARVVRARVSLCVCASVAPARRGLSSCRAAENTARHASTPKHDGVVVPVSHARAWDGLQTHFVTECGLHSGCVDALNQMGPCRMPSVANKGTST